MTDFVSCDDDAAETTGVFNDGNTVDLFQSLVDDARSTNIRESFKIIIIELELSQITENNHKAAEGIDCNLSIDEIQLSSRTVMTIDASGRQQGISQHTTRE